MLQKFREQIDIIDEDIINLLAMRWEVSKKVWLYKKENWIETLQKWRWEELLENRKMLAKEHWIKWEFIEKIWNEIHEYSKSIQDSL